MRLFYRACLTLPLALAAATAARAQVVAPAPSKAPPPTPVPTKPSPYGAGTKISLSPDGSEYVRFVSTTQLWTHYYNGVSRMSSFGSSFVTTFDVPGTNSLTSNAIAQTSRWLGVYAKGRFGGLGYCVSMNNSFLNSIGTP